jgi:antitoxin CcdA
MVMTATTSRPRKATNLSIDRDLLDAARECGINLSATLEDALGERIRALREQEWLAENREAIERYNESVERDGTFSDSLRPF